MVLRSIARRQLASALRSHDDSEIAHARARFVFHIATTPPDFE